MVTPLSYRLEKKEENKKKGKGKSNSKMERAMKLP